ncbi:nucleotide disphospho-sugar-binding domain-containing protein [Kribbella sp. NPDC051718]|uniref:nucleotide disphospho-sugar-binding domain-containing protein n=1 Tax=Kribbella sp. NPDC051718 TaxID=3155168 RepID=UPI00342F1B65
MARRRPAGSVRVRHDDVHRAGPRGQARAARGGHGRELRRQRAVQSHPGAGAGRLRPYAPEVPGVPGRAGAVREGLRGAARDGRDGGGDRADEPGLHPARVPAVGGDLRRPLPFRGARDRGAYRRLGLDVTRLAAALHLARYRRQRPPRLLHHLREGPRRHPLERRDGDRQRGLTGRPRRHPPELRRPPVLPQPAVLEHADVFLSHAGMNSVMESLLNQVPLATYPQTAEQSANADRVTELGLGRRLQNDITPDILRTTINELTTDTTIRNNLATMADHIQAAGGPTGAADALEAYLARGW